MYVDFIYNCFATLGVAYVAVQILCYCIPWLGRVIKGEPKVSQKPWSVDRDGRVRTDKDRPVVLKAKEE